MEDNNKFVERILGCMLVANIRQIIILNIIHPIIM